MLGALLLLGESLTSKILAGGVLMVLGLVLFARESVQQPVATASELLSHAQQ